MTARHPNAEHWSFPAVDRQALAAPLERVNLRELEARPGRFEHHLMPVANIGPVQLEVATASEPLYFAHRNISDEYALPLATGDGMTDAFPFRTFLSDFDSHEDVGRINHKVDQLVLHPYGLLHWPGRLRPPFKPFEFAPGMRRCGLSLVMCSSQHTPPSPERPLLVSAGCEAGPKQYGDTAVPFTIADVNVEADRLIARVGDCTLHVRVAPHTVSPANGGYIFVVDGDGAHFPGDLIYVPAGSSLDGSGLKRVVVFSSDRVAASSPPVSWTEVPGIPFDVYEDGEPGSLPFRVAELSADETSGDTVRVSVADGHADVPRYWLARLLFRTALHGFRLGYLETYGGFYYDDSDAGIRFGVRGGGSVSVPRDQALATTEQFYRAVAPAGYIERVT